MKKVPLFQIFREFLKLGAVGFGGPIALISLMEKECSGRLGWISTEEFNENYLYCKFLPGPVAYQMAVSMGYHLRGRWGGGIAGLAFVIPGALLILLMSIYYDAFVAVPSIEPLMDGIRAGALVIIFDSVIRMSRPYRRLQAVCFMAIAGLAMFSFSRWEPLIILLGGLTMVFYRLGKSPGLNSFSPVSLLILLQVFWVHFKAGAFVFGTGLAIVPFLEHDSVQIHHWLTSHEFLDGIAFGQITPGPVTITSAFIGYKAAGFGGAILGLIGMYSPGLILVLGVLPCLRRKLQGVAWLSNFQAGALPMVIGCIVGAGILLASRTLTSLPCGIIFLVLLGMARVAPLPSWSFIFLGAGLRFVWGLFL